MAVIETKMLFKHAHLIRSHPSAAVAIGDKIDFR